jgi:hypothetical protein
MQMNSFTFGGQILNCRQARFWWFPKLYFVACMTLWCLFFLLFFSFATKDTMQDGDVSLFIVWCDAKRFELKLSIYIKYR